jgi:predicted nucleotidyltransferase
LAVRDFLLSERKEGGRISISDRQNELEWVRGHAKRFHLTGEDVKFLTERRWNYGLFDGRYFSVHPIRKKEEVKEKYGDYTYRKKGIVTGTAEISCAKDSFFLPAIYGLTNVSSDSDADIAQLVSYEVFFSGVFDEGDVISFHGVLEEVSGERFFHQVVVGGAGYGKAYVKFYLKP